MNKLQTFKPNNQAVAFGVKKTPRDTMPTWFKEFEANLNKRLDKIETNQTNDHNLLLKVIKLNNLKTE